MVGVPWIYANNNERVSKNGRNLVSITRLISTIDGSNSDMRRPILDILRKCLPDWHKPSNIHLSVTDRDNTLLPLAVTTPMVVELDQPHGVGVVDVRHVDIVEVHHIRGIIKTDVTGTN